MVGKKKRQKAVVWQGQCVCLAVNSTSLSAQQTSCRWETIHFGSVTPSTLLLPSCEFFFLKHQMCILLHRNTERKRWAERPAGRSRCWTMTPVYLRARASKTAPLRAELAPLSAVRRLTREVTATFPLGWEKNEKHERETITRASRRLPPKSPSGGRRRRENNNYRSAGSAFLNFPACILAPPPAEVSHLYCYSRRWQEVKNSSLWLQQK